MVLNAIVNNKWNLLSNIYFIKIKILSQHKIKWGTLTFRSHIELIKYITLITIQHIFWPISIILGNPQVTVIVEQQVKSSVGFIQTTNFCSIQNLYN